MLLLPFREPCPTLEEVLECPIDSVTYILNNLRVDCLEFIIRLRNSSVSLLNVVRDVDIHMLFSIPSNLFSLQVVVEVAEEEQGAIEPSPALLLDRACT